MSACPHYQKTLWLDVYDELAPSDRINWEAHLDTCEGCQAEKERMAQMVATMRENMPVPPTAALSPERLKQLSDETPSSIISLRWWRESLFNNRYKLIPAMATLGLLLFVAGIFNYKSVLMPGSHTANVGQTISENVVASEMDILENLDLLEDMETVQRLIHVVERASYSPPDHRHHNNTQGSIRYVYEKRTV